MKGWIVHNGFLTHPKHMEPISQLYDSAKEHGLDVNIKANDEIGYVCTSDGIRIEDSPDFVIFWDKDVRLARALEMHGTRVFNSSEAIRLCDDKSLTAMVLSKNRVPIPDTIVAPKSYDCCGYAKQDFLGHVTDNLQFPMVVKECYGAFGEQVHLFRNEDEVRGFLSRNGNAPVLFQQFIENSSGRDIRINVVGDEVVAAMYRHSANGDFRANVTRGGSMRDYEPSDEERELAIRSVKALKLDFAGVDILFGKDGPVVCEVNSNAHMKNIYDCTGIKVSDFIIRHIAGEMSK